jgi:hypothetical protein
MHQSLFVLYHRSDPLSALVPHVQSSANDHDDASDENHESGPDCGTPELALLVADDRTRDRSARESSDRDAQETHADPQS